MDQIPVLLDTDIGSDIDDAVALAYLLMQPRCELIGITTVTGDVQKRAALAEVTCRAAGREDVPIHCGRRDVLVSGVGQPNVPQYDSIAHLPHRLERPENTAVPFLRNCIRSRPHEVVLLSIGPLSNIALLFALDPEIPTLVKGLVSMAGCFYDPMPEWNCRVDPTATAITFAAKRTGHQLFGLDVTRQVTLTNQEVADGFVGPVLGNVRLQAERWFEHANVMTFHDPLAAASIFSPHLCGMETGLVTVESESGRTDFSKGNGPDSVARTVDSAAFFQEFWSVFARA